MSRWAGWIRGALEPSPEEIHRVKSGFEPELLEQLSIATAPTDDEVHQLLIGRVAYAEKQSRRRWAWTMGALVPVGGLALALAALMVWVMLPTSYGPIAVPTGAPQQMAASAPLRFGPSIEVVGEGTLIVQQASTAGTELELVSGRGLFEVDPDGEYRHLVIHAGEVDVEVKGTRFEVNRDEQGVEVVVLRGLVEVRHAGATLALAAGERWSEPTVAIVAVPTLHDPVPADDGAEEAGVDEIAVIPAPVRVDKTVLRPRLDDGPTDTDVELIDVHVEALAALRDRLGTDNRPTVQEIDTLREVAGPTHSIWHDAGVLRLQVRALDDPNGAIVEMETWLDLYSDSPRRVEVLWMHAAAARTHWGTCDRGLSSYVELTKRLEGPEVAEAAAYRGICAGQAGRRDLAIEWLDLAASHPLPRGLADDVASERSRLQ